MDIQAKTDYYRFKIVYGLMMAGFKRILIYKTFIHADTDTNKSQEIIVIMK